jgi:NTP pyrophosphatase (non-canonical NTP hydrolase)
MRSSARRTSARAVPLVFERRAALHLRKLGDRRRRIAASRRSIAHVDLSEYQRRSRRTAEYPRSDWLAYPALGLAGEAGEVAEHAKKAIRDDDGTISDTRRQAMAMELGDVLWYVAQLASELDLDLNEIAESNLEKLLSRQRRGVLSGSGDDR